MPSLRSIFSLLALGSVMVDNPMPQRILARAIRVAAFVILGSMLTGAFLLAIIAFIYKAMVSHGIPETDAMLYILGIIFIVMVGVIITAYNATNHLLDEVKVGLKKPMPITEHLGGQAGTIIDSFVRGFLSRYNSEPRS